MKGDLFISQIYNS